MKSKDLLQMYEDKYYVAKGMSLHGGSFFKFLGEALFHADMNNTERIFTAFPKEWHEYLIIGKKEGEE